MIFTKSRLWIWVFLALAYGIVMSLITPVGFYHSYLGVWLTMLNPDNSVVLFFFQFLLFVLLKLKIKIFRKNVILKLIKNFIFNFSFFSIVNTIIFMNS